MPVKAGFPRVPGLPALLALCALLAFAPRSASAQQCGVDGAFGMDFGTVTPAGAQSSSYIAYHCQAPYERGYFFHLCLFLGPGAQGSIAPRRMTNYNGSYLDYDLYSDPARQALIGDVGSTPVYRLEMHVPANSRVDAHAFIYGAVHPGQSVPAFAQFKETGMQGRLLYLYDAAQVPSTADCGGGDTAYFATSEVVAHFENACTFSAGDLNFGQVDALTQPVLETSSIRVDCPADAQWSLGLGNGLYYAAGTRRMEGGGNYIGYQLYRDPGRTQDWGNTGAGDRLAGSTDASGNPVNVTVYGRVPAQPEAMPGHYADMVVATLYY